MTQRNSSSITAAEVAVQFGSLRAAFGAIEKLASSIESHEQLDDILAAACARIVLVVPSVDMVSVTEMAGGIPRTTASSDAAAESVDHAQYSTGQGPCLLAAATGMRVYVDARQARERWPVFADTAAAKTVEGIVSIPMTTLVEHGHASMNVYTRARPFSAADVEVIELYTAGVTAIYRSTVRYLGAARLATQLECALASRAVIDQAKGIMMAVRGIGADTAFQVLAAQSQDQNVKVRVIAERFVSGFLAAENPDRQPRRRPVLL